jgi:sterol desaturase/sphingolipid hydroxylase (fatty acid hydroxylase superfamily)
LLLNGVIALAVLAAVFVPLERFFALRREQRVLRPGWGTDVVHFLANPVLRAVAIVVIVGPFVVLAEALVPGAWKAAVTSQPPGLQLLEALTIVVIGNYWTHRMTHTVPFLWRFHRVHHQSEQLDWLAATHLHPIDTAFSMVLPVVPLAALGFSRATFGASIVLLQLLAILDHANVRWTFGRLRWILPNPQWHHWHHSNEVEARNRNFSNFPFVDKCFGSAYVPHGRWPSRYGVDDPMPKGYLRQLASPFKPRSYAGMTDPPSTHST